MRLLGQMGAPRAHLGQTSHLIGLSVNSCHSTFYARSPHAFKNHVAPAPYQLRIIQRTRAKRMDFRGRLAGGPAHYDPIISTSLYLFDGAARLAWKFLSHRIQNPGAPLPGSPQSWCCANRLAARERCG